MVDKKKTVDEDSGVKDSSEVILTDDCDNYTDPSLFLKNESDLFDEDKNIKYDLISVRRINSPKTGENWDISYNKKCLLRLRGEKFSTKEKEFLRTVDGVKFILNGYKSGWSSLNKFKQELKALDDNSKRNKKSK